MRTCGAGCCSAADKAGQERFAAVKEPADDADLGAEVKKLRLAQEQQLDTIADQALHLFELDAEQSRQASEIRQLRRESLEAAKESDAQSRCEEGEEREMYDDIEHPLVRTSAKLLYDF